MTAIAAFDPVAGRDPDRREFVRRRTARGECWVACKGGVVVGYAVLDYSFYSCGFVALLMVDPGHRREGVGAALMLHLESLCETEKLFTSTNESNAPMQALLAKLGYAPSGTIYNLDPGDPELVYVKALRESAPAAG